MHTYIQTYTHINTYIHTRLSQGRHSILARIDFDVGVHRLHCISSRSRLALANVVVAEEELMCVCVCVCMFALVAAADLLWPTL
jgi:hypothetical protein